MRVMVVAIPHMRIAKSITFNRGETDNELFNEHDRGAYLDHNGYALASYLSGRTNP